MQQWLKISLIGLSFLFANTVVAHQLSTSYIIAEMDNTGRINGEWQLSLTDLELAVGLDLNANGELTWGEVTSRQAEIASYLAENLLLSRDDLSCNLRFEVVDRLQDHANEAFAVTDFSGQCAISGSLNVKYNAIFALDSSHEMVLNIGDGNNMHSFVLDDNTRQIDLDLKEGSWQTTFTQFVYQGVIHIWIGIDHILFLLALLLPAVLQRRNNQWQAITSVKTILTNTVWIISAFTLAHSLTLTATALGWLTPSSRWVELGIAISVLFAALNNIWPVVLRLAWLTFAFGLLHGMGFAGVLGELGLPADQQLLSILAFNLGVEIGQLAILAILLPVLILLRNTKLYSKGIIPVGSLLIAIMAVQWSIERW
ncbi:HupE/UreJ family protein [Cognaticolwellia beringensis]|uniref:HupE/UreJ family protein n=1 Tax=Cognaticolwellia beringensis TaxID=1967665 RepID=A0A222GAH1_9GAMM|nr:HupE/UreJ family protein [Cognaticolwellia beringensis]ASP48702.1 hypothetical protein B5D82_13530 [Cognaticolwellia beringensis]